MESVLMQITVYNHMPSTQASAAKKVDCFVSKVDRNKRQDVMVYKLLELLSLAPPL